MKKIILLLTVIILSISVLVSCDIIEQIIGTPDVDNTERCNHIDADDDYFCDKCGDTYFDGDEIEDEPNDEKPEDKPEDKKPEDKPVDDSAKGLTDEQKKAVGDAAIKDFVAAQALASRCEPLFGKIVMDGLRTPQDVAVKVCMMDSALKFVDAGKALDALTGRLDEFEKSGGKSRTTITDSAVTASFDFSAAFASRK